MPKRYKYGMHHQWITSNRIGELRPIFLQEVTPGDSWKGSSTGVFRLAPLDYPAYMSLNVFVHFFFVPHRLVWDEFEDHITGAAVGTWPVIAYNPAVHDSWKQFGVGICNSATPNLNALPIRAYNKVYNEHFRNHLIESERNENAFSVARVRFPSNDYYGGIATELQQGSEVTIDTSGATLPINDVTDAMHAQNVKERRSHYGERYRDLLLSDYNVRVPDSRLDRPEHLARGKTTIGISEVVATATSASENTGDYRGHGIAGMRVKFPKRYFSEHGTIVGVMYARPRLQLKSRHDKMWYVQDKDDLYNPLLSQDSDVVVKAGEVYSDYGVTDTNFGYQNKFEHLRSARDTIAGTMQDSANEGWTAHVDLTAVPTVSYLQQVQDYDHIYQDQTAQRSDLQSFFDHKIGKISCIKPKRK